MAKRTVGVHDRYEYPAHVEPSCPSPGVYVLSKDVENPNFDKRSTEWHKRPVFKAGTKVTIVKNWRTNYDFTSDSDTRVQYGCRIGGLNDRYPLIHCIQPGNFAYEPLVDALVAVNPNDEEYLAHIANEHGSDADTDLVLLRLMKQGVVTREQIEAAIIANAVDTNA